MTKIFQYDRLSWPEVKELPRSTPLIIPLGEGYTFKEVVASVGDVKVIGLLPALPFGWTGSGLSIEESLLTNLILNLINSLYDDGFTRVYVLCPQERLMDLNQIRITTPHPRQSIPQLPVPTDSDRDKVILIPCGHTEQHAYHLPMSTDTSIIDAIAQGIVNLIPQKAARLPVMPYGVSTHRSAFAGTLNCGGRAYEDFWLAVIDQMVNRGFTKFYFINGHGGNSSFLVNTIKYAGERHHGVFCATAWLYLSGSYGVNILEKSRQSKIGGMGHACELETSLLLYLNPDLVRMEKAVDETDFISTPSYYMDWIEGGALIANPPWYDDTISGAYGAPTLATKEKGRSWLEAAVAEKVEHVEEIHQQYKLRMERRLSGFGRWRRET